MNLAPTRDVRLSWPFIFVFYGVSTEKTLEGRLINSGLEVHNNACASRDGSNQSVRQRLDPHGLFEGFYQCVSSH